MRRSMSAFVVAALAFSMCAASASAQPAPAPPPAPEGMVKIFNGTDLTGWEGNMKLWSVKDGVIRGETTRENTTKGNTFLIWRGGELADFDLRLFFRIERGNSGVQYRSQQKPSRNPENQWVVGGYQAEVENTPGKVGFLYHEQGPDRGYPDSKKYMARVGDKTVIGADGVHKVVGKLGDKAAIAATYKKGDWNEYVIIARGSHIQHFINGVQTIDFTDEDPKNALKSGILALQIHAGPPMWVEFKDIRLKQYEVGK